MSKPTHVSNSMYCFLPTDVKGFGPLAELALDLRWSWDHPHFHNHRHSRRLADSFTLGENTRVCPAPASVLAISGHHAAGLCDSNTGG